jgi:hypothetical protein
VHATDVTAQVIKVPVQSTLDGSSLSSRITARTRRGIKAVFDTIDGAGSNSAFFVVRSALERSSQRTRHGCAESFAITWLVVSVEVRQVKWNETYHRSNLGPRSMSWPCAS